MLLKLINLDNLGLVLKLCSDANGGPTLIALSIEPRYFPLPYAMFAKTGA